MWICAWCQQEERFGPEKWTMVVEIEGANNEKFEFCCFSCLKRWVDA